MLRLGAKYILTTIFLPIIVYGATTLLDSKERIKVLEEKEVRTFLMLREIRTDIKTLLQGE